MSGDGTFGGPLLRLRDDRWFGLMDRRLRSDCWRGHRTCRSCLIADDGARRSRATARILGIALFAFSFTRSWNRDFYRRTDGDDAGSAGNSLHDGGDVRTDPLK